MPVTGAQLAGRRGQVVEKCAGEKGGATGDLVRWGTASGQLEDSGLARCQRAVTAEMRRQQLRVNVAPSAGDGRTTSASTAADTGLGRATASAARWRAASSTMDNKAKLSLPFAH